MKMLICLTIIPAALSLSLFIACAGGDDDDEGDYPCDTGERGDEITCENTTPTFHNCCLGLDDPHMSSSACSGPQKHGALCATQCVKDTIPYCDDYIQCITTLCDCNNIVGCSDFKD